MYMWGYWCSDISDTQLQCSSVLKNSEAKMEKSI